MPQIFISYVEEDNDVVVPIARALERLGYSTWYYQRDSVIGSDYLEEIGSAIDTAEAFILIISEHALPSHQVTAEVRRAHECNRPFIPILRGITHIEFQKRQPAWRQAVGTTVSLPISEEAPTDILPKLADGLSRLRIHPAREDRIKVDQALKRDEAQEGILCQNADCQAINAPTARRCQECNEVLPIIPGMILRSQYRVTSQIGWTKTPLGLVASYVGQDLGTSEEVTIKCLHSVTNERIKAAVDHFAKEAAIYQILANCPHVIRKRAFWRDGPVVHLVLDRVAGVSLQSKVRLAQNRLGHAFSIDETDFDHVVNLGVAICEILESIHFHNPTWILIDLDPSKILIEESGQFKLVSLEGAAWLGEDGFAQKSMMPTASDDSDPEEAISFGIEPDSQIDDDDGGSEVIGLDDDTDDAEYKAPEALNDCPSPQSDLFSLASILYHLSTGCAPKGSDTALLLEEELRTKECPFPQEQRWFFELIRINLSANCSERYVSVEQVKHDLKARKVSFKPVIKATGYRTRLLPTACPNPGCRAMSSPLKRHCRICGTPLPIRAGVLLHRHLEIEKLIGEGGFSFVYQVYDHRLDRRIVMKDMKLRERKQLQTALRFFHREADILNRLRDAIAIVPRSFGAYINEPRQTARLFMEMIDGLNLGQILRANPNKRVPFDKVLEWGRKLCDLLQFLHDQDPPWIYRDMKPDQLMIQNGGNDLRVLDFGSARPIEALDQRKRRHTRVLTKGYSAPEQILGKPVLQSDFFSLSATLFHLVTGMMPEGLRTGFDLSQKLRRQKDSFPKDQRWFFEILRVNLSEDPRHRYSTANEFKRALETRRVSK